MFKLKPKSVLLIGFNPTNINHQHLKDILQNAQFRIITDRIFKDVPIEDRYNWIKMKSIIKKQDIDFWHLSEPITMDSISNIIYGYCLSSDIMYLEEEFIDDIAAMQQEKLEERTDKWFKEINDNEERYYGN